MLKIIEGTNAAYADNLAYSRRTPWTLAALVRIFAAFEPSSELLHATELAWFAAVDDFAVMFGPLLIGRSAIPHGINRNP